MSCDSVNFHLFFFEKNVITNFEDTDRSIQVRSHEVRKAELVIGRTYKHRSSICKSCYRFAWDVIEWNETATIRIACQGMVVEFSIYFVHIYRYTQQFLVFFEQVDPCVEVGRTVVAMYHGYGTSIGSSNHIDHFVGLWQIFLQYNHGEWRCTCRYVSCTLLNGIGCNHTGTCISFGRANRYSSFQMTGYVEHLSTFRCQETCILTSRQCLGKNIQQFPVISLRSD